MILKKIRGFLIITISSLFFLFSYTGLNAQEQILGETTIFNESEKMLLTAKPAVVQITNITTGELVMQSSIAYQLNAPELSGKTYNFEVGFNGSGFFVSGNGYLITNGHVAKPDNDTIAYYSIYQMAETIMKDAIYYAANSNYGYYPDELELEEAYQYILSTSYNSSYDAMVNDIYETDYLGGNINLENLTYENYIQTGVAESSKKQVVDLGLTAKLLDTIYEGDFDSDDLALLQVEGLNFPTVNLGNFEDVHIGKEVYAIGYPGVVEQATGILTDKVSELEPSITKGIISAKRKLVDGTIAFQTDAGITHGSSGGPVIDANGKVLGVATWSFGDTPGGESFNFLISVEQVDKLLARNNIVPEESETTEKWNQGLELYSQKCYTDAKENFEDSKSLYSDNVDIDRFITEAEEAIINGEDVCVTDYGSWLLIGGIAFCFGTFVVFVLIITFIIFKKSKKKSQIATP